MGTERGALRKALDVVGPKSVSWYRDGLVTGGSVPAPRARRLLQDPEAPRGPGGSARTRRLRDGLVSADSELAGAGVKPYCDELGCTYATVHRSANHLRLNSRIGRASHHRVSTMQGGSSWLGTK